MAISPDMLRGHTDTIILRFLDDNDSYGYEINKHIRDVSENTFELSEATMYTAFRRLEKDGLIESYWGNENSGARRRYYRITAKGRRAYQARLREWDESKKMIERLVRR